MLVPHWETLQVTCQTVTMHSSSRKDAIWPDLQQRQSCCGREHCWPASEVGCPLVTQDVGKKARRAKRHFPECSALIWGIQTLTIFSYVRVKIIPVMSLIIVREALSCGKASVWSPNKYQADQAFTLWYCFQRHWVSAGKQCTTSQPCIHQTGRQVYSKYTR